MRTTIARLARLAGRARLARFGLVVAPTLLGCASADHDDERILSQASALTGSDPVSAATTSGCTTAVVRGLGTQLVDEIQCMKPGSMSKLDDVPNVAPLGPEVFPFLQTPARTALIAAAASRGVPMNINSALRSLPEQYILYRWYKLGRCGIQLAATPGTSNHESGLALDIDDNAGWRTAMQSHDFKWLGPNDVVHYDYVGPGAIDMKGLSVLAFQKLWNRNHPEDPIVEDSSYGQDTETRLAKSPLGGFLKGASCREPDAGPPAAPDAAIPEPPARSSDPDAATALTTDDAPATESNGCNVQPSTRARGTDRLALFLGLGLGVALVGARRARRRPRHHAPAATGCVALLSHRRG